MSMSKRRASRVTQTPSDQPGLVRFEVCGRDTDRELIRALAQQLTEDGPEAARLRALVGQAIAEEPPQRGGILAALRRSPLVGADLDLERVRQDVRPVDL